MKSIRVRGVEVREDDTIKVTGHCVNPKRQVVNLVGVVATVEQEDEVGGIWFKMWPVETDAGYHQLTDKEKYEGKFWFIAQEVKECVLLDKGLMWPEEQQ